MPGATDFFTQICGISLRCRRIGPEAHEPAGDTPCLVFLHEALGCVEMWKAFPERLCQRTGLPGVLYDRQGHGGSDPLDRPREREYLHREAREILPALLRSLDVERPVFVGHSDGGTIALLFAAAYPDWACCAVVEAAHVFVEEVTRQGIREAVSTYYTTNLESRLAKYHGDKSGDLFRAWSGIWLSDMFSTWNMHHDLPFIQCPLLVIQGEDDEYGTLEQVHRIVHHSSGPATPFVVSGCGHIPHLEAQERVLEAAGDFICAYCSTNFGSQEGSG
jgi:pimeloyl-ACP methyl ester carboxylesterase